MSELDQIECQFKEISKLKAENEELKKQLQEESDLGHKAVQEEADSFFEALKYKQCLDEIEEIVKNFSCENCKEFSRCLEKRTQSTNSLKVELSYLTPNIEEINKIIQMIPSPTRCDMALEKVILQKINEVKDNG